jgi:exodeoxyribonuclease V beta subunit
MEGDAEGHRVTKQDAETLAAQATAMEIARLLTLGARGEAQIGQRPLEGGDMAVLVRTHHQGRRVRDALLRLRVASVQLGQDNIFASCEALELERILRAVAQPTSASLVRGALATVMLGATGESLAVLQDDEQAWEECVAAFQEYHRLWQEAGFAPMWRTLTAQEQVSRRLLGFRDGERRLTNLLHVAELLQAAADRQRTGMTGLLTWLAEQRQRHAAEDEEAQLRLESDEHLVKIVTIYKSKGLEYPIVFCPFLWSGRLWSLTSHPLSFHHPDDAYHTVLDLGSPRLEDSRVHACREEAAENLRLLYVALTRARHCCYLVWGAIRDLGASPLAWLLHQPEGVEGTLTREVVEAHVNGRSAAELRRDVERCAALANGVIRIEPLPSDADTPYQPPSRAEPAFAARRFPGPIRAQWRMTSFTALAADAGAELPDYDALARPLVLEPHTPEPRTIFTFPRGVRAGRCFHAMFERLDFTQQARCMLDGLVAQCLAEHGFDILWVPVVAAMMERVLTAPLNESGGLSLHRIAPDRRLTELEFYYPVAGLTCEGLQRVLSVHGFTVARHREEIERLSFAPTRGYMKGFIDLVFEAEGRYYLVDYKSHWLGNTAEAYRVEALHQVMAHERYDLQYLIYTLAVHRYLRLRLPGYDYDTHFGGVLYLFVRGIDSAFPTHGIFHDRPAKHLIEALDTFLATGSPRS